MVILALAVVAVGLVHLRRAELIVRHDAQRLQLEQVKVRRQLWGQQITLSYLAAPAEVRRRSDQMCLDLVERDRSAMNAPSGAPQRSAPTRRP